VPTIAERRRGVRYYRTIRLPGGKYVHIAIVKKAGPRGGHTIAGVAKERKHG
jgi:hypothetical protein